jgi:hypothetical protein
VHSLQPDVHGDMAFLEDGPDLDGERLAASVTLTIYNAAMRAYPTIRPDLSLDVSVGGAFIAKTGFVEDRSRHRSSPCRRIYNA